MVEDKVTYGTNKVNESVWVTLSFNDPSGWAFIEGPKTRWRPELYRTKGIEKQWVKKREIIKNYNKNNKIKYFLTIMCNTLSHFFLDTFANMAFNDVSDFIVDLVISSAVVIGPPVECRRPIGRTEGWLTCFQGRGCYDIQWHDNTAEWKARQYVVQALVNQTHSLWTSNWLTSLNCA